MDNKHLKKAQKSLKQFFTYFKEENVLVVSEDKTQMPFAYVIYDYHYPDKLLVSLAINDTNPILIADFVLLVAKVRNTAIADPFYISSSGRTYFNEDAYFQYEVEKLDLTDIIPISKAIN